MKSLPFSLTPALAAAVCAAAALAACDKPAAAPAAGSVPAAAAPAAPTPVGEAGSVTPEPTVPAADSSLAGYKTAISGIRLFMESHQNETDSVKALDRLRELVLRLSAVKTEGLPADLAAAFNTVRTSLQRTQTAFDALPVPVDQFENWVRAQVGKGGEAAQEAQVKMEAFAGTMDAIQKDLEPAAAKMNETGARYGVEPLDLSAP